MLNLAALTLSLLAAVTDFRVDATANVRSCTVQGTVSFTMQGRTAALWLYPNRLSVPPPHMDGRNRFRYYPSHFVPGRTKLRSITPKVTVKLYSVDSIPGVLAQVSLSAHAALPARVRLSFTTHLPPRYGPLSCMDGRMVLGAPWYPLPVMRSVRGVILRRPLWFSQTVSLFRSGGGTILMHGRLYRSRAVFSGTAPFIPAVLGEGYTFKSSRAVRVFARSSKIVSHLSSISKRIPKRVLQSGPIWLVEAPLREELAMALPGRMVLVGDRAFMVLPLGPFKAIHTREIVRAMVESHYIALLAGRERGWVSSMLSYAWMHGDDAFERYLRKFDFLPQIDNIMNAPAMDYVPAYAKGPEIPDWKRDDYRRWNNNDPRGSRIWGKMAAILGEKRAQSVLLRYLQSLKEGRFIPLKKMVSGLPPSFWRTWLSPYPKVDYSVGNVRFNGKEVSVEVRRSGAHITEPVDIEVTHDDGTKIRKVWNGRGDHHTITYSSLSPPVHVTVDPGHKLVEVSGVPLRQPRWNNEWPSPRVRFIYTGTRALFNITELLSNFYARAAFFEDGDLSRRLELSAFRSDILEGALSMSLQHFFGRLVLPHKPIFQWDVGGTMGVSRQFTDDEPRKLYTSLYTYLRWSTMKNITWPQEGIWGRIRAGMRVFIEPDSPSVVTPLHYYSFSGGGALGLPWWGMTLSYYYNLSHLVGRIRYDVEYLRLGGPRLLRGYSVTFFQGKTRAFAGMELRHHIADDVRLSFFDLMYVNRISGALFTGAGVGINSNDEWAYGVSAGYSLRFHILWGGLYETVLEVHLDRALIRPTMPYGFYFTLSSLY